MFKRWRCWRSCTWLLLDSSSWNASILAPMRTAGVFSWLFMSLQFSEFSGCICGSIWNGLQDVVMGKLAVWKRTLVLLANCSSRYRSRCCWFNEAQGSRCEMLQLDTRPNMIKYVQMLVMPHWRNDKVKNVEVCQDRYMASLNAARPKRADDDDDRTSGRRRHQIIRFWWHDVRKSSRMIGSI